MAMASSWHPALMPNSIADIIPKDSTPPPNHTPSPENAIPPEPSSAPIEAHPKAPADITRAPEGNEDKEPARYVASSREGFRRYQNLGHARISKTNDEKLTRELCRPQTPTPSSQLPRDEDTELDKLRNALTTSLASPGGVEMDENPEHNDASSQHLEQDQKADFPTEGPTPNKHISTMSFARTVSEDVNWAEEEDDVVPEIQGTLIHKMEMML